MHEQERSFRSSLRCIGRCACRIERDGLRSRPWDDAAATARSEPGAPERAARLRMGSETPGLGHEGAGDHRRAASAASARAVLRRALDVPELRPQLRHAQHPRARVRRRSGACSGASGRCRSRSAASSPRSRSCFTLTGNIVGVFFLMPVAIISWFVFIRPDAPQALPRRDRRPAALGPARGRPAPSSGGGRLVQPERRALVVAAELEVAERRDRVLVALDVDLLDRAAELAHARRSRRRCRRRRRTRTAPPPASPGCSPPGMPPVSITKPLPDGPGVHRPAEQAGVEGARALGVLDAELEEGGFVRSWPRTLRRAGPARLGRMGSVEHDDARAVDPVHARRAEPLHRLAADGMRVAVQQVARLVALDPVEQARRSRRAPGRRDRR